MKIRINEVMPVLYDQNTFLMDVTLMNHSSRDYYILEKKELKVTVNTKQDTNYDVSLLVSSHNYNELPKLEISDHFPDILFSDSADKMYELPSHFFEKNITVKKVLIQQTPFYFLPKTNTINIRFSIYIATEELLKIKHIEQMEFLTFLFAYAYQENTTTQQKKLMLQVTSKSIIEYLKYPYQT